MHAPMPKSPRKKKAKRQPLTARTADKHALYESSVQDTSVDIRFINRVFVKERGRPPLSLREDFCGTALLCAGWVRSAKQRTASGLDLHQPTMDWGREHHLEPLGSAAGRAQLLCRNVMDGVGSTHDVAVAFNFSYCALKTRQDMLRYFACVRRDLTDDGAFFLDIHGGTECFEEMEESTKHPGYTYVWDQGPYDAINGFVWRYIHFRFPDGTQMHRAFSYDWRMWTLPELRDILEEVGFKRIDVYWEGSNAKGEGNGSFRKVTRADNEASWIAYIVAWR